VKNNNRKNISRYDELQLFAEVDGICPNCPTILIGNKGGKKRKDYEIAHIYPLNPKVEETEILKNQEILNHDLNHSDNLICLCLKCHNEFDNPRTLEEYLNLLNKKKDLIRLSKEKSYWLNSNIENEIFEIIDFLANEDFDFNEPDILNYNPKTIDDKTDYTITKLTKRKIHKNVQDYFNQVKNKFRDLDSLQPGTTETISIQIKQHYLLLKKNDSKKNQKEIFDAMIEWLNKRTNNKSCESSEIIISYFIQNCEIFE
jgi:hypothetical protein